MLENIAFCFLIANAILLIAFACAHLPGRGISRALENDFQKALDELARADEYKVGKKMACAYCGRQWKESQFYPGTCFHCGGPK